jgi:hypothetical protein
LFYFVCSISVGRCRLIAAQSDTPDDHFRFRKFGSRRVMDSISRRAVVWWWSRASYGVSPTTPPIETAPTIGLWRVLSLRHFRPARSGSLSVGEGASSGAAPAERPAGAGDRLPAETPPTWSSTDTLRNLGRHSDISAGAIGLLSVGEGASSGAPPAKRPAGAGDRLPAETPPTWSSTETATEIGPR